jgi:hypothetical protein
MKMLELLENHPKSTIVVRQWFLSKMLETLNDENLPEDFKKHVMNQGIELDRIANVIDGNSRSLFDIFDNHKIYIETLHEPTGFWWKIKDDSEYLRLSNACPTRKEADTEAIIEAFKLLEEKL